MLSTYIDETSYLATTCSVLASTYSRTPANLTNSPPTNQPSLAYLAYSSRLLSFLPSLHKPDCPA